MFTVRLIPAAPAIALACHMVMSFALTITAGDLPEGWDHSG